MFRNLQDSLNEVFRKLRGRASLSEQDVDLALREVRMALLEADVNLKVVRKFIAGVKEKAVGTEVWKSLSPGQQVIKLVRDELMALMGSENSEVVMASKPPTRILLFGLNGAGKTTTAGKLGLYFKGKGLKVLLVAADMFRAAAVTQLEVLGHQIGIDVFSSGTGNAVDVVKDGIKRAESEKYDVVIVDTAGRLHANEELMKELESIKKEASPHESLLVVDAMTGQDAVNIAEVFNSSIGIDGIILTKLDSDTRGGAALSVKEVTGCPIKFVGMGEKLSALDVFHPDRIASRILGMGDVLSLIERAEETLSEEEAKELERKFVNREDFTLQDFLKQIQQIRRMGSLKSLLCMIPGVSNAIKDADIDEKQVDRIEAIIRSMTPKERRTPSILNASRKKRIAGGSGTEVADVNRLLKHYEMSRKMIKQVSGMSPNMLQQMAKNIPYRMPWNR